MKNASGVCIPVQQRGRGTVGEVAVLDNSSEGVEVMLEGSYKVVVVP